MANGVKTTVVKMEEPLSATRRCRSCQSPMVFDVFEWRCLDCERGAAYARDNERKEARRHKVVADARMFKENGP